MPVYKGEEAYTPEAIRDNLTKAATSFVANIMDIFEPMVDAYAANVTNSEDPNPGSEVHDQHHCNEEEPFEEEDDELAEEPEEIESGHDQEEDNKSQATRYSYGHDVLATTAQLQVTANTASLNAHNGLDHEEEPDIENEAELTFLD